MKGRPLSLCPESNWSFSSGKSSAKLRMTEDQEGNERAGVCSSNKQTEIENARVIETCTNIWAVTIIDTSPHSFTLRLWVATSHKLPHESHMLQVLEAGRTINPALPAAHAFVGKLVHSKVHHSGFFHECSLWPDRNSPFMQKDHGASVTLSLRYLWSSSCCPQGWWLCLQLEPRMASSPSINPSQILAS